MKLYKLNDFAPLVLRLGLAAVLLWFGTSQLTNSTMWTSLVPPWALSLSHVNAISIIHINGVLEIIFGAAIALGIYVRWAALIMCAHLFVITIDMGNSAIGARDFALSVSLLALAFMDDDTEFNLAAWPKK